MVCNIKTTSEQRVSIHQDVLDFVITALDVVHHHVLSNVFTVLHPIHLIVSVCVEV